MPKTKKRAKKTAAAEITEVDSIFFFKLLLYLILGSLWLKVTKRGVLNIPIPVGLIIGLVFTSHEHFQIDKKIEYAVLLVAMLIGFFVPYGFYLGLN
ncbi:MAG TPA: hypothetical protein VLG16_05685 [Candidatus Saccharimonadales bacterium]|nr:hypothetical protein [Candidatus Saccharimonadales bacterium]